MTAATTLDPASFDFVRKLVHDHSAIALEDGKEYLVESRLLPVAQESGLDSLRALIERLQTTPYGMLHVKTVEAMTTNETSFFRDNHPFEVLKTAVLPELIKAREARKTLRLWCAACSSGQEPYTIAMLLMESFPVLKDWTVQVLCTDISQQMLDRSQAGEYSQLEVNRGLPAQLLVKYFQKVGMHWKVKPDLKKWLKFQQLNLAAPWPVLQSMDVVFIRNVLIYFTPETKRQILHRIRGLLAPDGTMFLGGAESTMGIDDAWQRVSHGRTSTYRLGAK